VGTRLVYNYNHVITFECGGLSVVIDEVSLVFVSESYLPASGKWQLLGHGATRILPLSYLTLMVGKVDSTVRKYSPL
jgi:hypothetical protein